MQNLAMPRGTQWWRHPAEGVTDPRFVLAATCGAVMLAGAAIGQPVFVGAGSAGLCMACRNAEQLAGSGRESRLAELATRLLEGCGPYTVDGNRPTGFASDFSGSDFGGGEDTVAETATFAEPKPSPPPTGEAAGLVDTMLRTGRHALLLRPETAPHLDANEYQRVLNHLDETMAIVPAGAVLRGMAAERATLGQENEPDAYESEAQFGLARVAACYLDRLAVTNADYQHFVDAGGYEQFEYWPEEALPALFDFVDETGEAGPRFWVDGHFRLGEARLPVVGVSWYEAAAYARWVGRRLPTDAEWTKACAWPIESAPGRIAQRRYPWGETFDARRANLWAARLGGLAPVDGFADGATVGGLQQMVGNVWEWTADTLDNATPDAVRFQGTLRSLRGGAFNTYFENQATCHYQSGEHPLARRANIGVRLALDMAGLASPESPEAIG